MHPGEWAMLLVAAVALVVRCFLDRTRPLWCDEAYTAFAVADPSFTHMLGGLRDEINAMPPASFVLGWGIARVFGVSEFALRLPSALFTWVGIVLLWLCLRRSSNRWVATWCAICLPLASSTILSNATEARCYALYFAASVAGVALYLRCGEEATPTGREASREGWLVTLTHGILVAVHYVGGLLSALLVVSALAAGLLWRSDRHRRYALQGAVGWLAVLPGIPFYLAQRRLGGEFNWIPKPGLVELQATIVSGASSFPWFISALLLLAVVAEANRADGRPAATGGAAVRVLRSLALLLVAGMMFVVAAWIESRIASNIFLDRYLFPLSIPWMIAIAFVADALVARLWWGGESSEGEPSVGLGRVRQRPWGRWLVLAMAGVLTMTVSLKVLRPRPPVAVEVEALEAMRRYPDLPVVTDRDHSHVELGWYHPAAGRVILVNDSHHQGLPIGLRIGAALERHYLPGSVKSLLECTEAFDAFLFVARGKRPTGVDDALNAQPGWRATPLGPHTTLWERGAKGSAE